MGEGQTTQFRIPVGEACGEWLDRTRTECAERLRGRVGDVGVAQRPDQIVEGARRARPESGEREDRGVAHLDGAIYERRAECRHRGVFVSSDRPERGRRRGAARDRHALLDAGARRCGGAGGCGSRSRSRSRSIVAVVRHEDRDKRRHRGMSAAADVSEGHDREPANRRIGVALRDVHDRGN